MRKIIFLFCTFLHLGLFAQIDQERELNCSTPHTAMPEADQKAFI